MEENKRFLRWIKFSGKEWYWRFLFVLFLIFLNMILITYASMFLHEDIFFKISLMVFMAIGMSINILYKNGLNYILGLNSNMKECKKVYISKGFSVYNWYSLRFLGIIWWVVMWGIFCLSEWEPAGILISGPLGWCLFFKLQTVRESKWCSEVMEVNHRFINIKILQFMILYVTPLYLIDLYSSSLSKSFLTGILFGCVIIWCMCIFPTWMYLQAGERTGFFPYCKWWMLSDCHLKVNRTEYDSEEMNFMETLIIILIIFIFSIMYSNKYN